MRTFLIVIAWLGVGITGLLAWRRATDRPDTGAIVADARAKLFADGAQSSAGSEVDRGVGAAAFRDVTHESGLISIHRADLSPECRLPEPLGPGLGLLDFDGDAVLDVFVAAGGALPPESSNDRCQLWTRDSQGRFRNVAEQVGADVRGPAYGVACADYDGDGDTDIFVTRLGADVLLRNDGGRYRDVARDAGVAGDGAFGCSAAFFDYDRDGDLDLYVTHYVDWSPTREHECLLKGRRDYCSPTVYDAPTEDRLWRNEGGGRFVDATQEAGIGGHLGNGLGVVALDFDADGWEDLYVANDVSPAFLWHNLGDGTFAEVALERGAAFSGAGIAISGMGVVSEDLNGDGRPDLVVTNIADQSHLALLSRGANFYDGSTRSGLARWSVPATAFGLVLFDQDLDGALDLYVGNGAIQLGSDREGRPPMAEDDQFARLIDGRFVDATDGSGAWMHAATRGVARGDLDGDGDEDLVLTSTNGMVAVLRNDQPGEHHWIAVDVLNEHGSAALGAVVEWRTDGAMHRRRVRAQESYLSSSAPRVHIGLGTATTLDRVAVIWPDGEREEVTVDRVDRLVEVRRAR